MHSESSKKFRVVVFISGRGSNLKSLLECSAHPECEYEVVGVISDKGKAAGLELASEKGIETKHVPRKPKEQSKAKFNSALADAAEQWSPDIVVLAGFMRILSAEFISRFPGRIINVHPSLLPAFPGLDVQQQAIDAGVSFSGCTVHFVTEEVDDGPIIGQAVVPVIPGDDADSLSARILKREHQLYPVVVNAMARGQIRLNEEGSGPQVQYADEIRGANNDSFLLSLQERKTS